MFLLPCVILAILAVSFTDARMAIVNGESASTVPPWLVLLIKPEDSGNLRNFICQGSLIAPRLVLTAGHCITDALNVARTPVKLNGDESPVITSVTRAFIHPRRSRIGPQYDIAVLVLKDDISDNNQFLQIIDPGKYVLTARTPVGVLGFGMDAEGNMPTTLQAGNLKVWPKRNCIKSYSGRFNLHVGDGLFCANRVSKRKVTATCDGDSGTPAFVQLKSNEFIQVGIASSNMFDCQNPKAPALFTNIATFYKWINFYREKFQNNVGVANLEESLCPPGAICSGESYNCRSNYEDIPALRTCRCKAGLSCTALHQENICDKGRELSPNGVCVPCKTNFYKPRRGNQNCMPCPAKSYFHPDTGEEPYTCFRCPPNSKCQTLNGFECPNNLVPNLRLNICQT